MFDSFVYKIKQNNSLMGREEVEAESSLQCLYSYKH